MDTRYCVGVRTSAGFCGFFLRVPFLFIFMFMISMCIGLLISVRLGTNARKPRFGINEVGGSIFSVSVTNGVSH